MASQVLSGASNPTYTNNTGQNVRIIINFMAAVSSISWAGVSATSTLSSIGRNLAYSNTSYLLGSLSAFSSSNNAFGFTNPTSGSSQNGALPTELMLAPGQTFTATCGAYNIVVIPEAG